MIVQTSKIVTFGVRKKDHYNVKNLLHAAFFFEECEERRFKITDDG